MKVSDIHTLLHKFNELGDMSNAISPVYSDPWNPLRSENVKGRDIFYHQNYKYGLYIYSENTGADWNKKLTENSNEIWYIGKSLGSIRARIWKHIAVDSKSIKDGEPIFKNHRWANDPKINNTNIGDAIASGDFNVYAIPIKSANNSIPPEIVETFLLCCHYKSLGRLPILNSIISQYKPKN